jgi:hypothetical protein
MLVTHQSYLNKNKLEYYLDEYVFRYNLGMQHKYSIEKNYYRFSRTNLTMGT